MKSTFFKLCVLIAIFFSCFHAKCDYTNTKETAFVLFSSLTNEVSIDTRINTIAKLASINTLESRQLLKDYYNLYKRHTNGYDKETIAILNIVSTNYSADEAQYFYFCVLKKEWSELEKGRRTFYVIKHIIDLLSYSNINDEIKYFIDTCAADKNVNVRMRGKLLSLVIANTIQKKHFESPDTEIIYILSTMEIPPESEIIPWNIAFDVKKLLELERKNMMDSVVAYLSLTNYQDYYDYHVNNRTKWFNTTKGAHYYAFINILSRYTYEADTINILKGEITANGNNNEKNDFLVETITCAISEKLNSVTLNTNKYSEAVNFIKSYVLNMNYKGKNSCRNRIAEKLNLIYQQIGMDQKIATNPYNKQLTEAENVEYQRGLGIIFKEINNLIKSNLYKKSK